MKTKKTKKTKRIWTSQFYKGIKIPEGDPFKGLKAHVDSNNPEWGRICDDVEILQVYYHHVLAYVPRHRANILIPKKDIK